jgi:hypothetical protein
VRARRGRFGFGQVAAGRSKASFQCTMRGPAKRRSGVPSQYQQATAALLR